MASLWQQFRRNGIRQTKSLLASIVDVVSVRTIVSCDVSPRRRLFEHNIHTQFRRLAQLLFC